MITFAVIGGGWRSEFYLRIAQALPEEFTVAGVYIRREEQREYIKNKYKVKTFALLDELLCESFDFIVNCASYAHVTDLSVTLADKGYFV
ncbi:MAG: gfo/Idh/MocA family oxidoreductase, partial [Clostridia bacterium]|nr:gfo/Idh/MocA family oxidoreductase [Clostridia bacterium]